MSTLTDADRARGLTEPEGDARDLAAKLADARRLAESAARTAARLTRERDEARAQVEAAIDTAHLARQRNFSLRTFGPGARTAGVLAHIRKELAEIEAEPLDLSEWADVVILALDGAWRTGAEPQQIIAEIKAKQSRNESRAWPDWRTADPDAPIEHVQEAPRG